MFRIPDLVEPPGDPVGVRAVASLLQGVSRDLGDTSRLLADSNERAAGVWDSQAQRVFSLLAEGYAGIIHGSGGIAQQFAAALHRYADVLAACQDQVRNARQRLHVLAASTPAGMVPDPSTISALTSQAYNAQATAAQAARELSATALDLTGAPGGIGQQPGHNTSSSFVSQTHTATADGHISTAPATSFDAQAAHVRRQVLSSLMTATRPNNNVAILPTASPPAPGGTVMLGSVGSHLSGGQVMLVPGAAAASGGTVMLGGATPAVGGQIHLAPGSLSSGPNTVTLYPTFNPQYEAWARDLEAETQQKIADMKAAYAAQPQRSAPTDDPAIAAVEAGLLNTAVTNHNQSQHALWEQTFNTDFDYSGYVGDRP